MSVIGEEPIKPVPGFCKCVGTETHFLYAKQVDNLGLTICAVQAIGKTDWTPLNATQCHLMANTRWECSSSQLMACFGYFDWFGDSVPELNHCERQVCKHWAIGSTVGPNTHQSCDRLSPIESYIYIRLQNQINSKIQSISRRKTDLYVKTN